MADQHSKTLASLVKSAGGTFADGRPYEVTFPGGTKRYVVGKSPKDAAAKACDARLCTLREVNAAMAELLRSMDGGE